MFAALMGQPERRAALSVGSLAHFIAAISSHEKGAGLERKLRLRQGALMAQEPALALKASAIAGEGPIGADDAMAWNDDADRICPVGEPDGAHRTRLADSLGQSTIARGSPHRYL